MMESNVYACVTEGTNAEDIFFYPLNNSGNMLRHIKGK